MPRFLEVRKALHILLPNGWTTTQQGDHLESIAASLLQRQRYEIVSRVRFTGMEIDVLATQKDTGERIYAECKFHQGKLSANIVDLLLGKSLRHGVGKALIFSTAEPGKEAS